MSEDGYKKRRGGPHGPRHKAREMGTRLLGIYQALRVWPELNIDATDVLSQPLIEKFHQAASVRGVEAEHRVMLFE
jgi:hypothetical protein